MFSWATSELVSADRALLLLLPQATAATLVEMKHRVVVETVVVVEETKNSFGFRVPAEADSAAEAAATRHTERTTRSILVGGRRPTGRMGDGVGK